MRLHKQRHRETHKSASLEVAFSSQQTNRQTNRGSVNFKIDVFVFRISFYIVLNVFRINECCSIYYSLLSSIQ